MAQFKINFRELLVIECKVMMKLDLSVLYGPTVIDFVSELAAILVLQDSTMETEFVRFMESICIYILMIDEYKFNISLVCLISALVYFTAKGNPRAVERAYSLLNSVLKQSKDCASRIQSYKIFLFSRLQELGTPTSDLIILERHIDFSLLGL